MGKMKKIDKKIEYLIYITGLIGALTGLLIGYMIGNAIAVEEFTKELRWHYSPNKINESAISERYMSTYEGTGQTGLRGQKLYTKEELCEIPCSQIKWKFANNVENVVNTQ